MATRPMPVSSRLQTSSSFLMCVNGKRFLFRIPAPRDTLLTQKFSTQSGGPTRASRQILDRDGRNASHLRPCKDTLGAVLHQLGSALSRQCHEQSLLQNSEILYREHALLPKASRQKYDSRSACTEQAVRRFCPRNCACRPGSGDAGRGNPSRRHQRDFRVIRR
jgi:hypothetical protein